MSNNHSDKGFLGLVIVLFSYIMFISYTVWMLSDLMIKELKFEN